MKGFSNYGGIVEYNGELVAICFCFAVRCKKTLKACKTACGTSCSYGHLLLITGHKWDYTFHKWGISVLIPSGNLT